tara:strand:- start:217 stop:783 length:567 start_codon:yes stop_codon:yes gene_type:complete
MRDYFTNEELLEIGFHSVGDDNYISRKTSFYSIEGKIGSGNRIDDYCVIKGKIIIGNKVHICSHTSLSGVGGTITINDLAGVGVNNIYYTSSDNMLVPALCGPLVNKKHASRKSGDITIGKGAALGGRLTIMPNVSVGEFTAVGLHSIVTRDLESFSVYMTVKGDLKRVISRSKKILESIAEIELEGF